MLFRSILSLSLFNSFSLSLSFPLSNSLSDSLFDSLSLILSLFFFSLSLFLFVVYLSIYLSLYLYLFIYIYIYYLFIYIFLSNYEVLFSLFIFLFISLSIICSPSPLLHSLSGMDPFARRQMWDVIAAVSEKKSVVLTTHSMEVLISQTFLLIFSHRKFLLPTATNIFASIVLSI